MRHPASWTHAQVDQRVRAAMSAAMRADDQAIGSFVTELGEGRLDPYTRTFVLGARRVALGCTAALTCVLSAHRAGEDAYGNPVCAGCGTAECRTLRGVADVLTAYAVRPVPIDRAEAWRRADAWFGGRPVAVSVEEFRDGFIVRPAGGFLLVVDRCTGALSRRPSMPSELLVREYGYYESAP